MTAGFGQILPPIGKPRRGLLRRAFGLVAVGMLMTGQFGTDGGFADEVGSGLRPGVIPNPEFRLGDQNPAGWELSGGAGRWVDKEILEVSGDGRSSNAWVAGIALSPGGRYVFTVRGRRVGATGGCAILGPAEANLDWTFPEATWGEARGVFRAPDHISTTNFRVGQWQVKGVIQFDRVTLCPVVPIYVRRGPIELGHGETLGKRRYVFSGSFGQGNGNDHRVLQRATAGFNSSRWVISGQQEVIYRFHIPGARFTKADLEVNVSYHTRGGLLVDIGRDGVAWENIARGDRLGTMNIGVPDSYLPTPQIWVRLRGERDAALQVDRIVFTAELDREFEPLQGQTVYAEWSSPRNVSADGLFQVNFVGDVASARREITIVPRGTPDLQFRATVTDPGGQIGESEILPEPVSDSSQQGRQVQRLTVPVSEPGTYTVQISVRRSGEVLGTLILPVTVHEFHRADYGEYLGRIGDIDVWWCEADWKVARQRPPPPHGEPGKAIRLVAAKGDHESAQLVLRPQQATSLIGVELTDLTSEQGQVIPSGCISVRRVFYHFVHSPTDATGIVDWWPDALPPINGPLELAAGMNQPLWITVKVPPDAVAGEYRGRIILRTGAGEAVVSLVVRVWDFLLPRRNHLETAFGFDCWQAFRYHNATTEGERRQVLDLYFRNFAEHRISPYDPTPLDPIRVKFEPQAQPPRAVVDFSRFDAAFSRAVQEYGFTNFLLRIQGMGGGTFHDRVPPSIAGFGEDTPEYQAMFASQVQQIEAHLREKGWLPMAYVYWFDEPEPKDYEFVKAGMARLKKYAPGLARMLTEEPVEPLYGYVDIWCPVTPNYRHDVAEQRRRHGERFWWYVCTGPKAPYCTLFIDHPATELRVWLWQTWQRRISGVLVWATNYWTSSAAFPEGFQDPYEDPMSYVSGYSTPKGVKRHWGNGDGRFLYPPMEASVPGKSPQPVLAPPVSSIRWEMLREGIEDFEMLWLLADLLQRHRDKLSPDRQSQIAALLEVPPEITKDMTTFTKTPGPIHARRAQVAEAIETLQALEKARQ